MGQDPPLSSPLAPLLARASLLYLSAPLFIWLAFWLRTPLNLVAIVLLGFAVHHAWKGMTPAGESAAAMAELGEWVRDHRTFLVTAVVVVALVVLACGMGGLGRQVWDWKKNNAILRALIESSWPAYATVDGERFPVVYYLSFHLVPALVGRLTQSWFWTNVTVFVWGWMGTTLAFLWFAEIARRFTPWLLLVFVLASGVDVLGGLFWGVARSPLHPAITFSLWDPEWWTDALQYSSMLTALVWVPQHALGAWVGAGLAWYGHRTGTLTRWSGLLVVITAGWSPFAAVGILALVAGHSLVSRDWRYLDLANVAVVPVGLALAAFYVALARPDGVGSGWYFFASGRAGNLPGGGHGPAARIVQWLAVNFFEAGIFVLVLLRSGLARPREWRMLATVLVGLALLSTWVMGYNNDWGMRTSLPALFVLFAFFGRVLVTVRPRRWAWRVAAVLFVLALPAPGRQIWSILHPSPQPILLRSLDEIPDMEAGIRTSDIMRDYYLGGTDRLFFRYLAPPRRDEP